MNRTALPTVRPGSGAPPASGLCAPPRTDTTRIPVINGALSDTTRAVEFPWLRPPVTRRYLTPRARIERRWSRVVESPTAGHVRASVRSAFWPCAIGAGVILAALVEAATR